MSTTEAASDLLGLMSDDQVIDAMQSAARIKNFGERIEECSLIRAELLRRMAAK